MSTSVSSRREAGVTIIEMMVAIAVFATVFVLFAASFQEATDVGKVATVDAELRTRAQSALSRIVQDLRSTQPQTISVNMTGTPRTVTFTPIVGSSSSGAVFAGTQTNYSWDPTLGAVNAQNWNLSTIILTPYNAPGLAIAGEVTDFQVFPLGTTRTSGFSSTSPQAFEVLIRLSRRVFPPTAAEPRGRSTSVTLTTQVTVPRGK